MNIIESDAYKAAFDKEMKGAEEAGLIPVGDELKKMYDKRNAEIGKENAQKRIKALMRLREKYGSS